MIKALTVTNYLGQSKRFELAYPEKSGFAITNIEGLGPSKSNIITTEVSTNDGSLYNSAKTGSRNIVISLDFRFAKDIEQARLETYKYFPNKKRCKLVIETDSRTCETYGYVEDNLPDIFAKEETAKISIICPDPYLYSVEKTITLFSGVESVFEFPFENAFLTDNLLEMGVIKRDTMQTVFYKGDIEVGIVITTHAVGEAKHITIYNTGTRESMKINTDKIESLTGSGIVAGETITISTVKGDKYISLLRDGKTYNILNCLDRYTNWFQVFKGDNIFAYVAEDGAMNLQFSIENQTLYEGV